MCRSVALQMLAARVRTSSSPGPGAGRSRSSMRTSPGA